MCGASQDRPRPSLIRQEEGLKNPWTEEQDSTWESHPARNSFGWIQTGLSRMSVVVTTLSKWVSVVKQSPSFTRRPRLRVRLCFVWNVRNARARSRCASSVPSISSLEPRSRSPVTNTKLLIVNSNEINHMHKLSLLLYSDGGLVDSSSDRAGPVRHPEAGFNTA